MSPLLMEGDIYAIGVFAFTGGKATSATYRV